MKAIQIQQTGGPEVLALVDLADPTPGPGQILIRHEAVGVNFIDTYQREGLYPVPLPAVLGSEAAGHVEAIGAGVTRFKTGDRVGYPSSLGAYAQMAVVKADRAIALPEAISARIAASILLKGMTAEFLTRLWPVGSGDVVLVHAAAGGVGGILTQWLKHLGCTVIATVGSTEKAAIAKAHGCDHVILYRDENVAERVREITGGAGVRVVYDSVGKDTFEASLKSLGRRGLFVSFGNASGAVPPFEPLLLSRSGSLWFTRPTLFDYIATTSELDAAAKALFAVVASGAVKIELGREWPLAQARQAHEALQARQTTGANLLIP
jgi:NADPH2:quinone reductase